MINKNISKALTLLLTITASLTAGASIAQQNGERRGPPPEAIEACANQTEEAICSFTGPRGEMTGQCMVAPEGSDSLSCRPERGQKRQSS